VLGAWLVVLIALSSASAGVGSPFRDVFTIPGTDAQKAVDLLEEKFPSQNLPTAQIVFTASSGSVEDGAQRAAIEKALATVAAERGVVESVSNPFTGPSVLGVSKDGRTAVATVTYADEFSDIPKDAFDDLEAAAAPAQAAGLTVNFGGPVVDLLNSDSSTTEHADAIGLAFAVVILLFVFGTLVAAALPLTTAIVGVGVATAIITLLATAFTIGTVAPILGTMIGLGVGIDYSLLVVSRFRQDRDEGMDVHDAIGRAIGTAGSASLFAGCCVSVALCGLWFARIPYVSVLGFSAALFVAVMVVAALTLLPALLGLLGPHLDRLRVIPRRKHAGAAGVAAVPTATTATADATGAQLPAAVGAGSVPGAQAGSGAPGEGGFWRGWAHGVARHAWWCVVASLVVLLLLAAPVLGMRLGFSDDGDDPTSLTQRRAYDAISDAYGPGANGPLLLAVSLPPPTAANEGPDLAAVEKLLAAVKATPGIASVTPPIPNQAKTAVVALAAPTTAPNVPATEALVRRLRGSVIPDATAGTPIAGDVHIGGETAELIDLTDRINARLVWCIGAVVLGAFVILMMVFRSVLVPLKAAVMNLLSIGAAYGVVVAVFQWGWAKELIGLHQTVPIVAFVPLMMFAILFGLSMDYEVFLLSRIREEYLASGDNREAVASGLAKTARVISSAALIMIAVFLAFVTSPEPTVKMLGLGLAVAVFVDATIVRLLLVPATMELLGKANWWLPRWLDRVLPHLDVEGSPAPAVPEADAPMDGAPALT
jgi:RND superfamily putative drug exporter